MREYQKRYFESDCFITEVQISNDTVVTLVGNEDLTLKTVPEWNNGYFFSKGYKEVAGINWGFFEKNGRDCGLLYTDYGYTNNLQYGALDGIQAAILMNNKLIVDDVDINVFNEKYKGAYFIGDASYSLIKDGQECYDGKEHFSHFNSKNPRTMLGQRGDGTILMVVVDGRNMPSKIETGKISLGVTGKQQYEIMKKLGCITAVNGDGGGSSTKTGEDGEILNNPSDVNGPRKVASAIKVYSKIAIEKQPIVKPKMEVLAIGAGHGVNTEGKQSIQNPPIKEWSMSSEVVKEIINILDSKYELEILRVDDPSGEQDVTLKERLALVNSHNSTAYFDFHLNAAKVNLGTGTEVFHKMKDTSKFADRISAAIAKVQGLDDRGAKTKALDSDPTEDHYYTNRNAICPSYLIEIAFMTTWKDLKAVHDNPNWAKNVAQAFITELAEVYELKEKQSNTEPNDKYVYIDTLEDDFDEVIFVNGKKGTEIYIKN